MLREEGIEEIYDGHFYSPDDMVPVGCSGCQGCSDCCRNTGDSIILDPYDMYLLQTGTGKTFEEMIEHQIEIRLVEGLILPNLMQHQTGRPAGGREAEQDCCPFLSEAGRCTIHPYRPGFCRLYPVGRYYTEDRFYYIVQKNECTGREKTPVLLRDWLGIQDLPRYESFAMNWHRFRKRTENALAFLTENSRSSVARYILQLFFVHPYLTGMEFYPQYEARMEICTGALGEAYQAAEERKTPLQ